MSRKLRQRRRRTQKQKGGAIWRFEVWTSRSAAVFAGVSNLILSAIVVKREQVQKRIARKSDCGYEVQDVQIEHDESKVAQ